MVIPFFEVNSGDVNFTNADFVPEMIQIILDKAQGQ